MKKIISFFRKQSLENQPSSKTPSKQPIIKQREDSDKTLNNSDASDSSSSFNSRSGTFTIIRKLRILLKLEL